MPSTFSLSGLLRLVPRWVDDLTATAVTDTATVVQSIALTHGSAAGQANAYWRDLVAIPAGDSVTLDLYALPMVAFGGTGTVALWKVKMLAVINRSAAAAVSFGEADADRWAGYSAGAIALPAGATLFALDAASGYTVSGSSRKVVIENLSTTAAASVDIYIAGVLD
jgi:hypothetical protein